MTDLSETLKRYRLPLRRDHLRQARDFAAPALRYAPKNPLFFVGAAVLGIASFMAWRNRDRIGAAAGPLIEDARVKGRALMEEAAAKGHELMEEARAKGESVAGTLGETVAAVRRRAADRIGPSDVH